MNKKVHLRAPVAVYYDGKWVDTELTVGDEALLIGKQVVPLREIEDLEEIEVDKIRCIRIKKGEKFTLQLPQKIHQQIFRYIAFNLKADKFAVFFLASATVGGVVSSAAHWKKGYFSVTDEGFWFLAPKMQKRIPIDNLGSVKKDVRNVGKKQRSVLVLSHVEKSNVVTSLLLCPESTLDMLKNYLQRILEKHKPKIDLSEDETQILTLVYSGLDFASIENIMGISTEKLNAYYTRLVDSGLAKVVKIRKEIELTPRGVNMVDKIAKN
ncbi:MAG: CheF family chemotaxis protein [Methanosarcinaceae archaeon]|nr:CheF family chemotaxis protein [Methanosarcinaceae archaeon]MDD4331069.1 CheF family chemotaxis protein [Methanosarcinaceae archaeon]MDD4749805.1 CheF family chemotaxis protein [Methanosarcinaceae archaeon]